MTKILIGQIVAFGSFADELTHETRGAIAIGDDGRILFRGPLSLLPRAFDVSPREDYGDALLMAGFVDAHIHFPQYRMLAAAAKDLLDWLSRYTFPEEAKYADAVHAAAAADVFLANLFRYGTTSALAFCSSHKTCAEALFNAAHKRNMALITGKTLMDRHAIPAVQDTVEQGALDTLALHAAFHGKARLLHAVTPRFAITSTEAQLQMAGEVLQDCKGALMQTHLSESAGEIAWIKSLFPNEIDYTAVYERFGLVTDRSLFAHGIHLSTRELSALNEAGSTIVHCPTSNTFLGSGLMAMDGRNHIGLKIDGETGSLSVGKFADIIVLDPSATPVMAARHGLSNSIEDVLFALALLGDDRSVKATYIAGEKVHSCL